MKKQTYESAMKRLEEIVRDLEDGSRPLEDTLKLFEEGTKLAAFCNTCLDTAEQKIVQLTSLENPEDEHNA